MGSVPHLGDRSKDEDELCMLNRFPEMDNEDDWEGKGQDCAYIGWNCLWGGGETNGNTMRWDDMNCGIPLLGMCEFEDHGGRVLEDLRGGRVLEEDWCDEGWYKYGSSCYKHVSEESTFAGCIEECACEDATVACVDSSRLNEWIGTSVIFDGVCEWDDEEGRGVGDRSDCDDDFYFDAWVGVSDQLQETDWQCVSYGSPNEIEYENWGEDETVGVERGNIRENCATVDEFGIWRQEKCDLEEVDWDDRRERFRRRSRRRSRRRRRRRIQRGEDEEDEDEDKEDEDREDWDDEDWDKWERDEWEEWLEDHDDEDEDEVRVQSGWERER